MHYEVILQYRQTKCPEL